MPGGISFLYNSIQLVLELSDVHNCDSADDDEADDNSDLTCRCRAVCGRSKTKVMAECSADKETENCYRSIGGTCAGENELTDWAAACESGSETNESKTEEVPEPVCMSNRLTFKAEVELANYEHTDESCDKYACCTYEEVSILIEEEVTEAANHADTAAVTHSTNNKTSDESDPDWSVEGARAFCREEDECRSSDEEDEVHNIDSRHHHTFKLTLCRHLACGEGEALVDEVNAYEYADDKANDTCDSVKVTASKTENHTEWAAEEHESADHYEEAENESCNRSGTTLWLIVLHAEGHNE